MPHIGINVAKFRSFRQIPQKDMAYRLNISQQEYSRLEAKEEVDDDILSQIADILNFPVEAIKYFDTSATVQTVYQQNGNSGNGFYVNNNEKLIEIYERLLAEKDEVIKSKEEVIKTKDVIIEMKRLAGK